MTLENGQFTAKIDQFEDSASRREESRRIESYGPLVAATRASLLYFKGVDPDDVIRNREAFEEQYGKLGRDKRIQIILDTEELCRGLSPEIRGGCDESNIAFHTRRLEIITKILRANIAEDMTAVNAADMLMGNLGFDIDSFQLVKEKER